MSTTTAPDHTYTPAQQALIDAIGQLRKSERGRRALKAFRAFLEADNLSACGLDDNNLKAVTALADSCRVFGAYTVRTIIAGKTGT